MPNNTPSSPTGRFKSAFEGADLRVLTAFWLFGMQPPLCSCVPS